MWRAAKEARANALPPPADESPSDLYWLGSDTYEPVKIATANGTIRVLPAPSGALSLVVEPQERSSRVLLYRGKQEVKSLSVDDTFLLWSADARKFYFYGGTTLQADAWNVLGIYDLDSDASRRVKLKEPTEILGICPATGNVYSTSPQYPGFAGTTVEYTPTVQFVKKIRGWIGAQFSAHCNYVASESSYHGPLPWSIYNTANGKRLFQFDYTDDDTKGDMYALIAWNPSHDSILLRDHISKQKEFLEVFDVRSGRILQQLGELRPAVWSADGNSIILAHANELQWIPAKFGATSK